MGIKLKKFFLHHKAVAVTLTAAVCLVVIVVLLCLSTYIPRSGSVNYDAAEVKNNTFISQNALLGADLSLSDNAPVYTMAAVKNIFENNNTFSADALRIPLRLTLDGRLIVFGSGTLDSYTDCDEVFKEKNLSPEQKSAGELKQYNMGYHYLSQGKYPYRGQADLSYIRIITLEELLDYMRAQENVWKKNYRYFFEIKSEGGYLSNAVKTLDAVIGKYNISDRSATLPSSADAKKIASSTETAMFYISCVFGVGLDNADYSVLILPMSFCGINFAKKSITDYARSKGIAVYFEGIKTAKDAEKALKAGADGIFAEDPALAYGVLKK